MRKALDRGRIGGDPAGVAPARRFGTEYHILLMEEASGCIQAANWFVGLPMHFYTKNMNSFYK